MSVVPAITALREDHKDEGAGPERVLRDRRAIAREALENERANMVSGGLRMLVIDGDGCESEGVLFYRFSIDGSSTSHRRLFFQELGHPSPSHVTFRKPCGLGRINKQQRRNIISEIYEQGRTLGDHYSPFMHAFSQVRPVWETLQI